MCPNDSPNFLNNPNAITFHLTTECHNNNDSEDRFDYPVSMILRAQRVWFRPGLPEDVEKVVRSLRGPEF